MQESRTRPEHKIEAVRFAVEWSEAGEWAEGLEADSWEGFDAILRDIAHMHDANPGGYIKTGFRITFADGEEYTGRYDVLPLQRERPLLRNHVSAFAGYHSGLIKPAHLSDDDYAAHLKMYGDETRRNWYELCRKYDIGVQTPDDEEPVYMVEPAGGCYMAGEYARARRDAAALSSERGEATVINAEDGAVIARFRDGFPVERDPEPEPDMDSPEALEEMDAALESVPFEAAGEASRVSAEELAEELQRMRDQNGEAPSLEEFKSRAAELEREAAECSPRHIDRRMVKALNHMEAAMEILEDLRREAGDKGPKLATGERELWAAYGIISAKRPLIVD